MFSARGSPLRRLVCLSLLAVLPLASATLLPVPLDDEYLSDEWVDELAFKCAGPQLANWDTAFSKCEGLLEAISPINLLSALQDSDTETVNTAIADPTLQVEWQPTTTGADSTAVNNVNVWPLVWKSPGCQIAVGGGVEAGGMAAPVMRTHAAVKLAALLLLANCQMLEGSSQGEMDVLGPGLKIRIKLGGP